MAEMQRVVIVGGGFGGLYAAKSLGHVAVQLTVVDRRNFHLFQPLLYQVATGALSPANIASPLRSILKRQRNTEVILAEVVDIDVTNHRLVLKDGTLNYDTLIIAAGMIDHYFGHDAWANNAPGLKSIEDATAVRARILSAFEAAERETDDQRRREWLTFVIVGGGPTGVEMAGAIGEIAHHTLKHDFRHINPAQARILLVEGTDRILPAYPDELSLDAVRSLEKLGATTMTNTMVTNVQPECVVVKHSKDGSTEEIRTHTILWAAGVRGSPLGDKLAKATGTQVDKAGRLVVQPDLSLPNHPEIFVIGDLASFSHQTGKPLPGVAQVAMQQGKYVAHLIDKRLKNETLPPFHYTDLGNMATIGRSSAVADLGKIKLHGFIGWLAWLFIHLVNLIEFENRLLVLTQWAWNYFTRNRAARLITSTEARLLTEQEHQ